MYVSTVDSGNLSGHLLAVAQACVELARAPLDQRVARRAIDASQRRLKPMLRLVPQHAVLLKLLALADPLLAWHQDAVALVALIDEATSAIDELSAAQAQHDPPIAATSHDELLWCLADHVATLRSALLDASEMAAHGEAETAERLHALAKSFEQLAWQANFSFLYHRKRHLFHIGFRVAEQQLDASYYDLLASESRLTSLLAVAKGDVPTRH
jgi:cyclic beta-1,2-glucan synthetase